MTDDFYGNSGGNGSYGELKDEYTQSNFSTGNNELEFQDFSSHANGSNYAPLEDDTELNDFLDEDQSGFSATTDSPANAVIDLQGKSDGGNSNAKAKSMMDESLFEDDAPQGGDNDDDDMKEEADKTYMCWQPEAYRKYFNVDSIEIGKRLLSVAVPIQDFLARFGQNGDLYGPFWVSTTLLFLLAAIGNFIAWIDFEISHHHHHHHSSDSSSSDDSSDSSHEHWDYDFFKLLYATIAIYCYVGITPLIVWGVFKWFDLGVSFVNHLMLFGYSMLMYIPAVLLCIIPLWYMRWVFVMLGFIWSTGFLLRNYFEPSKPAFMKCLILFAVVVLLNFGMALLFRLYFLHM